MDSFFILSTIELIEVIAEIDSFAIIERSILSTLVMLLDI